MYRIIAGGKMSEILYNSITEKSPPERERERERESTTLSK